MSEIERLLGRLVEETPARMTALGYTRRTCILHTRVAVDTLRALGVRARPLATRVMIGNKPWADTARRLGRFPDRHEWEEGSWCLGVGYGPDPRAKTPGYNGHVLAIVNERYALDLTIDQAERPHHGIELAPHYWELSSPALFLRGEDSEAFRTGTGCAIIYDAMPEDREFLTAPDWTKVRRQDGRLNPTNALIHALARRAA